MPVAAFQRSRSIVAILAVIALFCAVVRAAAVPVARWYAVNVASRALVALAVDDVWIGADGVHLAGVRASLDRVECLRLRLDDVRVSFTWQARVAALTIDGGALDLSCDAARVTETLADWRARRGRGDGLGSSPGIALAGAGLHVVWSGAVPGSDPVVADGVAFERRAGRWSARLAQLVVRSRASSLVLRDADAELYVDAAGVHLERASAAAADLVVDRAGPGGDPGAAGAAPAAVPSEVGGHWLREVTARGAAWWAEHAGPAGTVRVREVRVLYRLGDQALHVGPAEFGVAGSADAVRLELAPSGAQVKPLLTGVMTIPTHGGPIALEFRGGPVALAALGVRDGDFGLVDVQTAMLQAHVAARLDLDAREIAFDGDGAVRGLALSEPRLASETVRGLDIAWRGRGAVAVDGHALRVDDGEIDVGHARLDIRGIADRRPDGFRVGGHLDAPPIACQSILESIPSALIPRLTGTRVDGTWAMTLDFDLDSARPDDLRFDWRGSDGCRVQTVPADVDVRRFAAPFRRMVYDPEGKKVEVLAGPGAPGWVPLRDISPFVEAALLTSEDAGFRRHDGFDRSAIRNSLKENVRARRFVRGASTLSMQLAKNLYLDREKTVSRKLQEAVLTMYLEQALTKDELLELYLNVVELGPMVYGIGPAATYWFGTTPGELTLAQATFLVSILPNPNRAYAAADGRLSARWAEYVRKLVRIMQQRKHITPEEMAAGIEEELVLHPTAPASGRAEAPQDDDSGEP